VELETRPHIELHIERGPVLLDRNLPLGAVLGTFGVERHAIAFRGQAAHSGSTPMNRRKDAFLAAGKMAAEIYRIAERSGNGVCTIGSCTTRPGIVTSVVEDCRITLDQRHLDAPRSRGCCRRHVTPARVSRRKDTSMWRGSGCGTSSRVRFIRS
jgi:acetylornithine deacetylase/succinyl-diaminopimelate desuccinylase-like protein